MNNKKHKKNGKLPVQAKASIVLAVSLFFTKGINFIVTPIFTRIMSTEEIGIVTTYLSWVSIIGVFANLSLDSGSFNIAMMDFENDRYGYMSSILTLSTISSLMTALLFLILGESAEKRLGLSHELILLMLTGFVFLPATNFWMLYQRYHYKYKKTALVTFLTTLVSTGLSVTAVTVGSSLHLSNLAEIRLVTNNGVLMLVAVGLYGYIVLKGKKYYNKDYWTFALRTNFPLMIHSLAKQVLDVSDRVMISIMIGKREVGIYGVLYSVSSLSLIIWNSINASLIPYMFECLKHQDKQEAMNCFITNIMTVYGFLSVLITLIAPEIVKIMAPDEYYNAIFMMPPVAAGVFLTSLYNIFSNVLLYYKKTEGIMLATSIAAAINIVLNYIFIPRFGYLAAAYTTLASYIILSITQYLFMSRICNFKRLFDMKKMVMISVLTISICLICNFFYTETMGRYLMVIIFCLGFILTKKWKGRVGV